MANLPEEILLNIFSCLICPLKFPDSVRDGASSLVQRLQQQHIETLVRLCQANKQFRRIAQPLLYHTLPTHLLVKVSGRTTWEWSRYYKLLSTLSVRPDLARCVREVSHRADVEYYRSEDKEEALKPANDALNAALEQSFDIPDVLAGQIRGAWDEGTDAMIGGARIAFWSCLAPNVELVELWGSTSSFMVVKQLWLLMRRVAKSLEVDAELGYPCFTNVREVRLLRESPFNNADTVSFIGSDIFLHLPNLEVVRGYLFDWGTETIERMEAFDSSLSKVREIHFVDAVADVNGLTDMMWRFPALRDMQIAWGASSYLDFRDLGALLRERGGELEKVDLDPRRCELYDSQIRGRDVGRLGSLASLRKLRELRLPETILVGFYRGPHMMSDKHYYATDLSLEQALPKSLEVLEFYPPAHDFDKDSNERLYGLMSNPRFSRLRELRFWDQRSFSVDFVERIHQAGWGFRTVVEVQDWGKQVKRMVFAKTDG